MLRAVLTSRGGGWTLAELPYSSLSVTRVENESGNAALTVPVQGLSDDAGRALAGMLSWRDEVAIYDDTDDDEPLWVGPLSAPSFTRSGVTLGAKDLFAWYDHRVLPHDRHYRDDDLALIFTGHAADAMSRDPSPNIDVVPGFAGATGDRDVLAAQHLYAGDAMRELIRSGVNMTMAGRRMFVSQSGRLPPLIDANVDEPQVQPPPQVATEETVLGASRPDGTQVSGTWALADAEQGLLQLVRNEPAIRDGTSALHAAQVGLKTDLAPAAPFVVTIKPGWAKMRDMIPGRVSKIAVTVGVKTVLGDHRLASVTFTAGPDGAPGISATFVPVEL